MRQELTNIRLELEDGGSAPGCASLCSPVDNMRSCLLIAAGLVMAQQLTGQPNVLYYAPTIFQQVATVGRFLRLFFAFFSLANRLVAP